MILQRWIFTGSLPSAVFGPEERETLAPNIVDLSRHHHNYPVGLVRVWGAHSSQIGLRWAAARSFFPPFAQRQREGWGTRRVVVGLGGRVGAYPSFLDKTDSRFAARKMGHPG